MPLNTFFPIDFFVSCVDVILIFFSFLQPEKAFAPTLLTFFPDDDFFQLHMIFKCIFADLRYTECDFPSSLLMVAGTVNVLFVFLCGFTSVTVHPVASAFVTL